MLERQERHNKRTLTALITRNRSHNKMDAIITRGEKNRRAHIIVTQCRRHCLLALVFADGFLRSIRTVRALLAIFIQAWTTRKPCRFLTATHLKDFRILILENKILKKETLNTT